MRNCSKLRGQKAGHCLYGNLDGDDHLEPDVSFSKVTSFQGQPRGGFYALKKPKADYLVRTTKAERRGLGSQAKLRISCGGLSRQIPKQGDETQQQAGHWQGGKMLACDWLMPRTGSKAISLPGGAGLSRGPAQLTTGYLGSPQWPAAGAWSLLAASLSCGHTQAAQVFV